MFHILVSHPLRCLSVFLLIGCSAVHVEAQFVVERSPWLDSREVTDDPIEQTWRINDAETNAPIQAELTVEGLNPRKSITLRINEDTTLKLAPHRRYGRMCVEPEYMLYADYIYADPNVPADTIRLSRLAVGMEVALPAIEFMPGTEELYFTSLPALEVLRTFFDVNPTLALAIVGHEHIEIDDQSAKRASRDRARAVYEYLVSSGVAPERLSVEGLGHTALLHSHPKTPEEAEANRRITIRVTNY